MEEILSGRSNSSCGNSSQLHGGLARLGRGNYIGYSGSFPIRRADIAEGITIEMRGSQIRLKPSSPGFTFSPSSHCSTVLSLIQSAIANLTNRGG